MNPSEIADFLAEIRLFRNFDERELTTLARHFEEKSINDGENLFREGDTGGDFYIITSGKIHLARSSGNDIIVEVGTLRTYDFFGEESYIRKKGHSATATAIGETTLLVMRSDHFGQLLQEFPTIQEEFEILAKSYQIGRRQNFEWLAENEIIHMITKKHYYVLLGALLPLLLFTLIGLYLVWKGFTVNSDFTGILTAFVGIMLAVPMTLWALWRWVDWGNDYYIVTDRRVVWVERIVLLYGSRNVVPLDAVLSVNVNSGYWQRFWKSGDVVVNTFTGRMTMKNVNRPKQFADAIEEYWHRAQQSATEEERQTRVRIVRENLGFQEREETLEEPQQTPQRKKPGLLQQMTNFLKTRYEENGTVTYRKHWFLLFRHSWKSILFLIAMTIILIALLIRPNLSFGWLILWLIILANVVAALFFLYNLVDWANDIYQVTDRHILDIDRKPLGQDMRKSAPLEQILSTRVGQNFWQRLLNYGDVLIRVGEAEFSFDGVVNPSMVQQEVFHRLSARKLQIEAQEARQERNRMVEWLKIYHDQVNGGRDIDHKPDFY
ncbi:MAG: cyclic nucleotide-binding domain-containing protein [Anaerolineales bacterium]|nr:cyclic nucleotide-binding domain-containing protein [Anaerolineales bacterium]